MAVPLVLLLVIGAVAGLGGDGGETSATESRSTGGDAGPTTHHVLYEVEGSTDWASVTIATPTGTEQLNPDVPLTRTSGERGLEATVSPGEFLYISAQNKRSHGTIVCRITVDGEVVAENESSGGYAVASCDGTAR
ncbi:MAG: hypothetical protein ACOCUN_00175 [Jiangellaceae bacterium]